MSKHFKKEELARCFREKGGRCSECKLVQPALKLPEGVEENLDALVANVLEPLRKRYGKPIIVNSGYRCSIHNAAVGGATQSQHMKGEAADIRIGEGLERLVKIIKENGKWDQMIIYPSFIHVSWKRQGVNRKQIIFKK